MICCSSAKVCIHSPISSLEICVFFEDGTHFGERGFQMVRYGDVTLDNTKERLVSDSFYDLILIQGLVVVKGSVKLSVHEILYCRVRFLHSAPLALPHLHEIVAWISDII